MTTATKKRMTYREMGSLQKTEDSIAQALGAEINREDRPPRMSVITRLVGSFSRLRGQRVMLDVCAAAKVKGVKDIDTLLDRRG